MGVAARLTSASRNEIQALETKAKTRRFKKPLSSQVSPIASDDVLAIPNSLGGVRRVDGCLNAVEDDNCADRDDGRHNASGDEDTHGVLGFLAWPQGSTGRYEMHPAGI